MACSDSILRLFGRGSISGRVAVNTADEPLLPPPTTTESVEDKLMASKKGLMRSRVVWTKSLAGKHAELGEMAKIAYKGSHLREVALQKLAHMKEVERFLAKIEKGLLAIDKAVLMLDSARVSKLQLDVVYQTKDAIKEAIRAIGSTEDIEEVAEELQETIQEVEEIQREVSRASEPRTMQQYDDAELERELEKMFPTKQSPQAPPQVTLTSSSSSSSSRTPTAMM